MLSVSRKGVGLRYGAILALLHLGPRAEAAVPLLRDLMEHEDEPTRKFTEKALEHIAPDDSTPESTEEESQEEE